jgi:signal transduction histidine kinase/ligand-binding sensor domain-containing protein/DNA-binding response OmpR family regulator
MRDYAIVVLLLFFVPSIEGWTQSSFSFVRVAPEVLSNANVRCFYKDSQGYMWIGTEEALLRYDGVNVYRYLHNPNDNTSITHNTVNTFLEDGQNRLWIGTARGLCIYDRTHDRFINIDSIPGTVNNLNNRYITSLAFDNAGKLWIGTHEGGINIYDVEKKEFNYIVDSPQKGIIPASNFINVLVHQGDTMWCGTKGELLLYNTKTKERLPLGNLSSLSNANNSVIYSDKNGDIWIANALGRIMHLKKKGRDYQIREVVSGEVFGESSNRLLALAFDANGGMYLGGENSGFSYIPKNSTTVQRWLADPDNVKRLPTNSIQAIYADDMGFIWIGTLSDGVFIIDTNEKKFETHYTLKGDHNFLAKDVRDFAEDDEENVWILFYGNGVGKYNPKTKSLLIPTKLNNKISTKNLTSILWDKEYLWIASAGKGIYRVNIRTNEVVNYNVVSDGFGNNQVFCLYKDRAGTIWAGTWGSGLFYYNFDNNRFNSATDYSQPNHLPNTAYISDMYEDPQGTFWVGTLYGLYALSPIGNHQFKYSVYFPETNGGSLIGAQIQSIVRDREGALWVATTEGLNVMYRTQSEFQFIDGYKGGTIRSLLTDAHGNMWIGGSTGLTKYDVNQKSFIPYTRNDGLSSGNYHRNASLVSTSGLFYFGGSSGFDVFHPDSIAHTPSQGNIVLTDLKINNKSVKPNESGMPLSKHISLTKHINLAYDQRSFSIDFVALNTHPFEEYTYCYKLKGFDKDYHCSSTYRSASYTNIDPGKYTLLVKVLSRDGRSIGEPIQLEIEIDQIFWKSRWAFLLYIVGIGAVIFMLIRVREDRLKLQNEIAVEKILREQEHAMSESKTQFFTNVAHEFRTPLSLILIPLERLMETKGLPEVLYQRIQTAYKNASQMKRLVNELLDFNKLEVYNLTLNVQPGELTSFIRETSEAFNEMARKQNIVYSMQLEIDHLAAWFDRDKLERILFNLLSNAFKFTEPGGEIHVEVRIPEEMMQGSRCVEIVVRDTGIGIAPNELPHIFEKFYQTKNGSKSKKPGTGIGLSLTKALVELHLGTIEVSSIVNQSTIFTIRIPVEASAYGIQRDNGLPTDVLPENSNWLYEDVDSQEYESLEVDQDDKARILLVEDNNELREYLSIELQSDFSVLEARDGEEALRIVQEHSPDLIISDVMMPTMNGIELCKAIKEDIQSSHIPFILLTAKATVEDQIEGINTGADLYIAKPFNVRYLITNVKQVITSRRKLYARFSQEVFLTPGMATNNSIDQEFLKKAIDFVVNNLQDTQLSVDSLAEQFNISRMQVYRKIKALTGKSVVEFIRMIRLKEAIKLMDTHAYTLSEIAYEVGFNSASYFTKRFREEYGKTPSEYLEQKV